MRDPAYRWVPDYEETYGDLAAEMAEQVGMPMDPEQQLVLDAIFAEDAPGVPTCFEVGTVAPRQNLKTATLEVAALTDVFLLEVRLHVWTAHLFKTAKAAFDDMVRLIDGSRDLRSRCKPPKIANGDEAIELKTGQRIEFHARSKGGGRGLTGDRVTFDEALFLASTAHGALLPILATRRGAQIRYGSSAGLAGSEVLRRLRDRGRAGGDPRLAWFEWAADQVGCFEPMCRHVPGTEGCALDREDLWEAANPALDRRITRDTLRAFRRSMEPAEFGREFLGWWDDPAATEPAFGPGLWEANATDRKPRVAPGGLAVAVSFDLTHASIGTAAAEVDDTHVRPIEHRPGTGWVMDRAKELQHESGLDVVIDGRGPGAMLIPHLEKAGVQLHVMDTGEVLDACAAIFNKVRERHLLHQAYPELDAAVAAASKRTVGDRWAWGRRTSSGDISPLEAVTYAAWAAENLTPRSAYEDADLTIA